MIESKGEIRRAVRARREALTVDEVRRRSEALIARLIAFPGVLGRQTYALYYPIRNEVDVLSLARTLLAHQRDVLFPRTVPGERRMNFHRVECLETFQRSASGVLEPDPACPIFPPDSIDIMIVPGVAFDRRGLRLGYGGGYYDGYLPGLRPDALKIAPAYDFQLFEQLPGEERDQGVDLIVSELETISAREVAARNDGLEGTGAEKENHRT